MPQSTPERRERWKDDQTAIAFLKERGYKLRPDWHWERPQAHEPTEDERDAIIYLIEEWDFGPWIHPPTERR